MPSHAPRSSDEEPTPGLLIQSGRQAGTRRSLVGFVTLIGRDPGCDVPVDDADVAPRHCLVVRGPDGYLVRDLGAAAGTLLNGERVFEGPLADGDVLDVGAVQFQVELPPPVVPEASGVEGERDALRIQAAAVVAQQVALTLDEAKLQERAAALERQEAQLAAHLEERRQKLLELGERVRKARDAFEAEQTAVRQRHAELEAELNQARQEALAGGEEAVRERQRLVQLRKRLRSRWRKHWRGHEAALARRDQELAAARSRLEKDAEALSRDRVALTHDKLRHNGDAELGRRQLHDAWQELALAQQEWEATLNRERDERDRRDRSLDAREKAIAEVGKKLAQQEREGQERRAALETELQGLETRIRNQRQQLAAPPAPPAAFPVAQPIIGETPPPLHRLVGEMADQRVHLLEQWDQLLLVRNAWEKEHGPLLAALDETGRKLDERENQLNEREQALERSEAHLRDKLQAAHQERHRLEGFQARLTAREAALDADRENLLNDVRSRESAAAGELRRLEELRQRWAARRRHELEELQTCRARCEEARSQYLALLQECQTRRAEVAHEQRTVASQMLAVEQARLELLGQSKNAVAVERRLDKLQRRNEARIEEVERHLTEERAWLRDETARLEADWKRAEDWEAELMAKQDELAKRQIACERAEVDGAGVAERGRLERDRLLTLHDHDQRQLAVLREEVERVARHLLDEPESSARSAAA